MKSKFILINIVFWLLATGCVNISYAQEAIVHLKINGKLIESDPSALIIDGTTFVPLRFISEKLGGKVEWNQANQLITIHYNGKEIVLPVGSKFVTVNGTVIQIDAPATIRNNRTMIPLRFVSENFGAEVNWDSTNLTVMITTEEGTQQAGKSSSIGFSEYNGIRITAETEFEKYLATNLIDAKTSFSLEGFEEANNVNTFKEILNKVVYQNPLIIDNKGYIFNESTKMLTVEYEEPIDLIKEKQQAMLKEATNILSAIIKPSMSDEEKRKAIYDYLANNTTYDMQAFENSKKYGYLSVDPSYIDSFTTYGVIVKKTGVCESYAYAFKLLCDMLGLDCIVVTGNLDQLPHAWNKVKVGDEWLNVDVTNNQNIVGVPYFLYEASDDTAVKESYTIDNASWVGDNIIKFKGMSNSYDYYVENNLEIHSLADFDTKLSGFLNSDSKSIYFRSTKAIDLNSIMGETQNVLNKVGGTNQIQLAVTAQDYIQVKKV